MSYRSVDARFWTDPFVRSLCPDHRYLFLYLITCPSSHYTGVYYCPIPLISYETGMDEKGLRRGFEALEKGGAVFFEEASNTFFVANMAKFHLIGATAENNMVKGIRKHFKENIQSEKLIRMFFDRYPDLLSVSGINLATFFKAPSKPLDRGQPLSETETDIETERETKKENTPPPAKPAARPPRKDIDCPADVDPQIYKQFLVQCKAKDKPCTEIVMYGRDGNGGIAEEAKKAGLTLSQALAWSVSKGYARFEAAWYFKDRNGGEKEKDGCRAGAEPGKYDNIGKVV